ncbi:hypothetical protein [Enterococcus casseliflavus]|uniref:hypothetical protein n=1 Tax=Enterococcus casseliflavus TaxID=37734 RepID=UPI00115EDB94|nr:hypothetical protein [Enterococcus casseliflavus]
MIDELVIEAGMIVSALESLTDNLYNAKFVDRDSGNKVIAQIKCLTVYAEMHSKKLDDMSIEEVIK